ncbi:SAM domain and HD domain-containing protein 1-like isoform 1 [Reticulomyxa filosa]|uniref:SAM domain and HD domain-containing protein 1-like isoform 1 n=1 Tax=Reticulomyxa filosa TaxID=46433 RepID=X6LB19_RETFI|nr:SAM domain and HD domain-containing protein 1-like isoform 1 [Reticulomyxa filosa]|eukprot:ETN98326.1 SAM domain and HD domain-containing protein 1-like isoform 1 [Reticulomyxa filosa]
MLHICVCAVEMFVTFLSKAENKKPSEAPPSTAPVPTISNRPAVPAREKRPLDPRQYRTWDSEDVYYWMSEEENGKWQDWASVLFLNQITGEMLDDLNGQDLVQLGIETLGARKKLLQMIKALQVFLQKKKKYFFFCE